MPSVGILNYLKVCEEALERDLNRNPDQLKAVSSDPNTSLFLTAGPGSGKTTVLALKVLKFIFVDDLQPDSIMATTFTRKAAKELRSRILGWGDELRHYFKREIYAGSQTDTQELDTLNFNLVTIGTLDSIAQEKLGQYRQPGTQPPLVIDDFASTAAMIKAGLFAGGRFRDPTLHTWLADARGDEYGLDTREKAEILKQIRERFKHDRVDVSAFKAAYQSDAGAQKALQAIESYDSYLHQHYVHDYADLETEFLDQLQGNQLSQFTSALKVLLVDEYQDTNLLQQEIYFEIAKSCIRNGGSLTVVGDDDQSVFRFRGATVEVFSSFKLNAEARLGICVEQINLVNNYRSTPTIVCSVNNFVELDGCFQEARVNKPPIIASRSCDEDAGHYPILCLFRSDVDTLAADLSEFIAKAISPEGYPLRDGRVVKLSPEGSVNDFAILGRTALDYRSNNKPRLPLLLRENLSKYDIKVFNPRGIPLKSVPSIQVLCGLVLECIDPEARIQGSISALPKQVIGTFTDWRAKAQHYITNTQPSADKSHLERFVLAWQNRRPTHAKKWLPEIALNDLIYKLMTWVPSIYNDIEGLVYLEAITRTVNQAGLFSNYNSTLNFSSPKTEQGSIKAVYWDILVPIAIGGIEIDEDLLETLPKNRLNIMTIHQAKGLEYPLVIVDVGSDFAMNHWAQARFRYPVAEKLEHRLEDKLRQFSPTVFPARPALDRAFDDLYRLYYVAFSRAQDVLMLVGLSTSLDGQVPNIAAGWNREREHVWRNQFQRLKQSLNEQDGELLLI